MSTENTIQVNTVSRDQVINNILDSYGTDVPTHLKKLMDNLSK